MRIRQGCSAVKELVFTARTRTEALCSDFILEYSQRSAGHLSIKHLKRLPQKFPWAFRVRRSHGGANAARKA